MKVKVDNKEVQWLFNSSPHHINIGEQANNMIKRALGDLAVHFAPMKIGAGFYTWTFPEEDWIKLSDMPPGDEEQVQKGLREIKAAVGSKAPAISTQILTVPNEGYIYYRRTSSGSIDIKFVAWGFKNYKSPPPGTIIINKESQGSTQDVKVAFLVDGMPIPNREFLSIFPDQKKPNVFATHEDGYYTYKSTKAGTVIKVIDKMTGKEFSLLVIDGQEKYEFDVTQFNETVINVSLDDIPVGDEDVDITYNGNGHSLKTDHNGQARIQLPYIPNNRIAAQVREDVQHQEIALEGNTFNFSFQTVPPVVLKEPKDEKMLIKVQTTENNIGISGEPVEINYCGQTHHLRTDSLGNTSIELPHVEGKDIIIKVRDKVQQKPSIAGEWEFSYDFSSTRAPLQDIDLWVEKTEGKPLANERITISQGDRHHTMLLDSAGHCSFAEDLFENGQDIIVSIPENANNTIDVRFEYDNNEHEYYIVGRERQKSKGSNIISIVTFAATVILACLLCPYFIDAARAIGNFILQ